jgi:hypothetical protein
MTKKILYYYSAPDLVLHQLEQVQPPTDEDVRVLAYFLYSSVSFRTISTLLSKIFPDLSPAEVEDALGRIRLIC